MTQHIPPWQDIAHLTRNLCICERTVDDWVRKGILPAPRLRGGKRLWRWTEVERYLEGEQNDTDTLAERIRNASREAANERR